MNRLLLTIVAAMVISSTPTFAGASRHNVNTQHETTMRLVDSKWQFSQASTDVWREAQVPGTVHTDLMREGLIPDPYYRLNERYVQWVDKCDWEYRTKFELSDKELSAPRLELIFEGLDTYADVYLNGKRILAADNMFRTWRVNIKRQATKGENELKIYFHSPIKKGKELYYAYGIDLPAANDQTLNGSLKESERVSVFERKAPYHFGWDWGPRLVTSGVFKPIYIVAQDGARIEDVHFKQPNVTKRRADIELTTTISSTKEIAAATIEVIDTDTKRVIATRKAPLAKGENIIDLEFSINNPELWWSNTLGEAHLYNFDTRVVVDGVAQSTWSERIGVRSLRLVERPDPKGGVALYFELNGVPIFTKGANHIPNDLFVDRMTPEVYETEIANAVDANMNMLRVWGGGIYELDYFYDLCDENGILVWQDFMFACSMYPSGEAFYESIAREAEDNIKRLRNHPSIALWCGNNEIDIAWSEYDETGGWGWKKQFTQDERREMWGAYVAIFKEILANAVTEFDPERSYRHSSPITYTPKTHSNYNTLDEGDIHYWDVWHGRKPIEYFHKIVGRYMSEYGFQAFPEMTTIKEYAVEEDFAINSEVMLAHQRSPIGNEAILQYMEMSYRVPEKFEDFIYLQQQLQRDAIVMAVEAHRHNMPHTMGSLYWQMNDCWPVASWSSTDYFRRWKALHYGLRGAFAPILITGKVVDGSLLISTVSDELHSRKGVKYEISVIDLEGKVSKSWTQSGTIAANAVSEILCKPIDELFSNKNEFIVIRAKSGEELLSQCIYYPTKVKDMTIPAVEPSFEITQKDANTVNIKASSPTLAKSLWIDFEGVEGFFSDNYIDVLPNESVTVSFTSKNPISAIELRKTLKYKHVSSITYKQ